MAPESGQEYPTLWTEGETANLVGGAYTTPYNQNVQLLNKIFKFKEGAPLQNFIQKVTNTVKSFYTLREILTIIKTVIGEERLFDGRNPSIVLCSKELEQALNQRALHITEVRDLVFNQIEEVKNTPLETYGSNGLAHLGRTICVATNIQTHPDAKFRLKPLFLTVIQSIEGVDQEQTIFTYEEACHLLSKYILVKRDVLFDPRNVKLAIVKNDPLGVAFGVSAFHRCQVKTLLRSQLIPVHPNCLPDKTSPHSTSVPGAGPPSEHRLITDMPPTGSTSPPSSILPTFPAPSIAASLPLGSSAAASVSNRKRVSLDNELGENCMSPLKQPRQSTDNSCNTIGKHSGEREIDSDIETVYEGPDEDPDKVAEMEIERDEDEEDTDRDDIRGFEGEYDIESGEEEKRPPQAHGRGGKLSSADDTDSEIDEQHCATPEREVDMERVYWADSEEEKGETTEFNPGFGMDKRGRCANCFAPTPRSIKYCSSCWRTRRDWVPERPRKGKGATKLIQTPMGISDLGSYDTTRINRPPPEITSTHPPDLCMFCQERPRNATFIHGRLGHQVGCYPCTKRCWRTQANCPVCKRRVEKIIKTIQ